VLAWKAVTAAAGARVVVVGVKRNSLGGCGLAS
jgi:hypothetical protein